LVELEKFDTRDILSIFWEIGGFELGDELSEGELDQTITIDGDLVHDAVIL
jgi:hypothetical protein